MFNRKMDKIWITPNGSTIGLVPVEFNTWFVLGRLFSSSTCMNLIHYRAHSLLYVQLKAHMHNRPEPQTNPCNITNLYVWTKKKKQVHRAQTRRSPTAEPFGAIHFSSVFLPSTKGFGAMSAHQFLPIH